MTSGTCGKNLTWTLDDNGTLTISGTGDMDNYTLYDYMTTWYDKCNLIKNIVIEEWVTSIGNWSFSDCQLLCSVDIPDSVTSIGRSAFRRCTLLTNIKLPDGITSISRRLFSGCTSLINIKIPNNVTSIGRMAFSYCTSLTTITIPEDVTSIDELPFGGCKSLKEIYYKRGTKIDLHKLTAGNKAELIPYDEFPPAEENLVVYSNTKYDRPENFAPNYSRNWSNVDDKTVAIRKAAELAAMNIVMNIERNLGFVPVDVSSQNLGYDIKSTSHDGKISRLIEVKGRNIDAESVTVSRNEIIAALNNPDDFILAIVKLNADKNETIYLKRPFEQVPDKAALSINFSIQKLVEASKIIPR